MHVGELLCQIDQHGVTLRCNPTEDRLHYTPAGALPQDLVTELKKHKHEVIQILREDESLNDEFRQRRATEIYEQNKAKMEAARLKARDTLQKHAAFAEKAAIPTPNGEPTSSSDPTKLLIDLQTSASIVRTIERQWSAAGPLKRSPGEYLTEQYRKGLGQGGLEGGSLCRGVLRAAEELGLGDDFLDPLRSDRDRERLDNARRLLFAADSIDTKAPKPPRELTRSAAGSATRRGGQFTHRASPVMAPEASPEAPVTASEPSHSGSAARKAKRKKGPSWK